jgi:hypothetical protein
MYGRAICFSGVAGIIASASANTGILDAGLMLKVEK